MNDFSKRLKTAKSDEWYTQEKDVEKIVPYLHKAGYTKILCPFDTKDSNFVKVLSREGFNVTYSHIDTGVDFFDIQNLSDYDAVVSNPPFSIRTAIFEGLFDRRVPFIMICNSNGLFDTKNRYELFKNNDFELLIPKGRMKFFNENGLGASPSLQSIYVCSGISNKQIEFMD